MKHVLTTPNMDRFAPLVAALAAHYAFQGQGQCPLPGFPPLEPPADEFVKMPSRSNSQLREPSLFGQIVEKIGIRSPTCQPYLSAMARPATAPRTTPAASAWRARLALPTSTC